MTMTQNSFSRARKSTGGFSLVELSIVLVILGLLTGGILAGQSLIRAAELRKISSQVNNYQASIQAFRDKYLALPADFSIADQFWGRQVVTAGCPGTAAVATATGTCSGDGNGVVDTTNTGNSEHNRFFEHLYKAGLIEGAYSYNSSTTPQYPGNIGLSVPRTVGNGSISFSYVGAGMSTTDIYLNTGHFMGVSAPMSNSSTTNKSGGILKPDEALSLDTKIDDGKPGTGTLLAIRTFRGTGSSCQSSAVADNCVSNGYVGINGASLTYNLQAAGGECSLCTLIFKSN